MIEPNCILRCINCWDSHCSLTEEDMKKEEENPTNCARCKQKGIDSKLQLIRLPQPPQPKFKITYMSPRLRDAMESIKKGEYPKKVKK